MLKFTRKWDLSGIVHHSSLRQVRALSPNQPKPPWNLYIKKLFSLPFTPPQKMEKYLIQDHRFIHLHTKELCFQSCSPPRFFESPTNPGLVDDFDFDGHFDSYGSRLRFFMQSFVGFPVQKTKEKTLNWSFVGCFFCLLLWEFLKIVWIVLSLCFFSDWKKVWIVGWFKPFKD